MNSELSLKIIVFLKFRKNISGIATLDNCSLGWGDDSEGQCFVHKEEDLNSNPTIC